LLEAFDDLDATDATAAVWLALSSEESFEFALSAMHADQGLNKRSWCAFKIRIPRTVSFDFGESAKGKFLQRVREAIEGCRNLSRPGRLQVHSFQRLIFPEFSHGRRELAQVTVYAEMRFVTEEYFTDANEVKHRNRRQIDQISVIFDRGSRELDVVSLGGSKFIRQVAESFCESFASTKVTLDVLIRRRIKFETLATMPTLALEADDIVIDRKVDEIRMVSPGGWLWTFGRKSREKLSEDVYEAAKRELAAKARLRRGSGELLAPASGL
jgi:hypothetical protein